ncbi:WD repeat-containing protein 89 [Colossoma macropomum]|uniref:WD repeat-containing protein 89 n=1 Tax=Colossoma macropomum TaxID=42526 RepID=UPI001864389F|nr:WD repeat-containing protein 89 [Colossoma macropomum]XP_036431031.1 WD repeat-containing protein 89 [Colossoma macropomum]
MDSLEDTFRTLSIARRLQPDDPSYILDVALPRRTSSSTSTPGSDLLAACCSNHTVRLHSRETLRMCGEYQGHTGAVFGVRFSSSSCDLIYTGSVDGTLRCWDVRRPGSAPARVFQSDPEHAYCSFDVSCNDRLLCAGTEQVGEDSFLVFWDTRMVGDGGTKTEAKQDQLLGVFSESHSDDITTVRFHPSRADRLASGATDGLVNVFDLSLGKEDDALVTTCNCDSSAGSLCWSGTNLDRLLCLSHDEGLHLWDLSRLDSDDPLTLLSSLDARTLVSLPEVASLDYFVGGTWLEEAGHLLIMGGSHEGELHLLECSGSELKLMTSLKGGHSATVRCFQWDPVSGALLTGGEDGELLQWKAGAEEISVGKKGSFKSISSMQLKTKAHRKHVTKRDKTLTA